MASHPATRSLRFALLLAAALGAGAPVAASAAPEAAAPAASPAASPAPPASRRASFGFDLGYGSGRVDYPQLVDGVRFEKAWRDGFALGIRAGWRASCRLTVGASIDAWLGDVQDARAGYPAEWTKDNDWSLAGLCATVTWRPLGGAFLRGAVGRATASVTFADEEGAEQVFRDSGLAWRLAAGYEWRIATDAALLPTLEWRRFSLGGDSGADVFAATLGMSFF